MKLARTFQILESDRKLTLLLGSTHFLVAAAYSFVDISATSLLIAHLGPDTLPEVYLASALVVIFVGLVIIPLVDRMDRARFFLGVLTLFAAVLLASSRLAEEAPDFAYRGLYVASFLMKSLVFLQFWLLAGDLLDIRQAKRLFPLLLGFSLGGGLVASAAASILPRFLATESLLAIAGGLLLLSLAPVETISRGHRSRFRVRDSKRPPIGSRWKAFRGDVEMSFRNPLLRTLSLFLLLLALLAQVLDFVLGKAAHVRFTTAGSVELDALTSFYAVLNGGVIGAGVLIQLVFANRVISSVGVTRGQLLAPATFVGAFAATGAVWMASGGGMTGAFFTTVVASKAIQKILRISLVRTSTDLIYNAIPRERRGRAKAFKETLIEPGGVLLSGLFLLAGTRLPLPYVLGGAFLLSLLFLASTLELKSRYFESLVLVLKEKGRFRFAFPSLVLRQGAARAEPAPGMSSVRRALDDEEASVRLLAVEVASALKEPEAASLLVDRVRAETNPDVRARMLGALGKMVHSRNEPADSESLDDRDPLVRASGMESLAQSGIFRVEPARGASGASEASVASVGRSKSPAAAEGAPSPGETTAASAPAGDSAVNGETRTQLFELARRADGADRTALERLVHYLEEGDGMTRHLAARALEACGETALEALTIALWSTDVEGRRYVIHALVAIGGSRARGALLPVLSLEAEEAYFDLVRLEAIRKLRQGPAVGLLADSILQRVDRARKNAHQILRGVFLTEPGMRLILSNLNHPDRYVRSSAIEALELRVDPSLLGGILPLFEHENPRSIAEHGATYFALQQREPAEVLHELTRHRSSWIRACAAFALGEVGRRGDVTTLEALFGDRYELARLNAIEAIGRIGDPGNLDRLEALLGTAQGRARDYVEAAIGELRRRKRI